PRVFRHEPAVLRGDEPLHLHCLADDGRDDIEELDGAVVVAVGQIPHGDAERADGLTIDRHGKAKEGELVARGVAAEKLPAKRRLRANAWDDYLSPRLDDAADDALAEGDGAVLRRPARAKRRFDRQFTRVLVEEHDQAAHGVVMAGERLEHVVK